MQISFHGISRLKFKAIRARVRAQAEKFAIALEDCSFWAVCNGFTTEWNYDEADQQLVVMCNKRPRLHTEGWVASRIQGLVESL
jgi:hypothetical protein